MRRTGAGMGLAAEPPPDRGVERAVERCAAEAKRPSCRCVIDARFQSMACAAPDRPDDWLTAIEHAHRRGEEREAVDEVGGAVDRIDGPQKIVTRAWPVIDFFADDVVCRKGFTQAVANERLYTAVNLRDRVLEVHRVLFRPLILDPQQAAQRSADFSATQLRQFDRNAFDAG